jgi:hypothetical protein
MFERVQQSNSFGKEIGKMHVLFSSNTAILKMLVDWINVFIL